MPSKRKSKYPRVLWSSGYTRVVQSAADSFEWEMKRPDLLGEDSWRPRSDCSEHLDGGRAEIDWRLARLCHALSEQTDKHERLKRSRRLRRRK